MVRKRLRVQHSRASRYQLADRSGCGDRHARRTSAGGRWYRTGRRLEDDFRRRADLQVGRSESSSVESRSKENSTMRRAQQVCQAVGCLLLAAFCIVGATPSSRQRLLRPSPEALSNATPELIDRLKADSFVYFRFVNRAWTA